MPVLLQCQYCRTIFPIKPSHAATTRYCSRPCHYAAKMRPLAERFAYYVPQGLSPDVCWNWLGKVSGAGYGRIRMGGAGTKLAGAHKVAWELIHGPIPKGMFVCHRCDNPPCVNPGHLFVDFPKGNTQDALRKNRMSHGKKHSEAILASSYDGRGEKNNHAKLQASDIYTIRTLSPAMTFTAISQRYHVSISAISKIVHRRTWKHLPESASQTQ
jgi:HNH endonuclease